MSKEIVPVNDEEVSFTSEEIDLLSQCLSKHFYSIGGMPDVVVSCANKLQRLKEQNDKKKKFEVNDL